MSTHQSAASALAELDYDGRVEAYLLIHGMLRNPRQVWGAASHRLVDVLVRHACVRPAERYRGVPAFDLDDPSVESNARALLNEVKSLL